MNTTLNQLDIGCRVAHEARRPGGPPSPRFRTKDRSELSLTADLVVGRRHIVEPEPFGLGGYLVAWTARLSFCWGLCGLAVSPAFEVLGPRWFIVAHGTAFVLMALVAPILGRWRRQPQTSGRPDRFLTSKDAAALWAMNGFAARVSS
jgi:hypothetical protein